MTNAARLRDSTQILLDSESLTGLRGELDERFVVTIREEENLIRIIGSPTEIKGASNYLARNGVSIA